MALPSSGQISLQQIGDEANGTTSSTNQVSLNDLSIRTLIDKLDQNQNSFSEYYGVSAETELDLPDSSTNINGQAQLQEITASDYISSGGTLIIPSSLWVWSDSTSTAALTIDIPCTVVNNGKIIGKGGRGGGTNGAAEDGGPAISVTSSGVTITNANGAYIAGGGGGGGLGMSSGHGSNGSGVTGGGGGAGGGQGGDGTSSSGDGGGSGGSLNASGSTGSFSNPYTGGSDTGCTSGVGGGAGGGGGGTLRYTNWADGGGGGRILPGTGGSGGIAQAQSGIRAPGGAGGSANNAGTHPGNSCDSDTCGAGGSGGGGWGADGGGKTSSSQAGGPPGSGGAAITGTSRTLNNNGTIYGATT